MRRLPAACPAPSRRLRVPDFRRHALLLQGGALATTRAAATTLLIPGTWSRCFSACRHHGCRRERRRSTASPWRAPAPPLNTPRRAAAPAVHLLTVMAILLIVPPAARRMTHDEPIAAHAMP